MGDGRFVSCGNCGNEWMHYNGIGMNRAYWYCNRCGACKEQEYEMEMSIPNVNGICSCGGSFVMEAFEKEKIICPKCQSEDLNPADAIFNWD